MRANSMSKYSALPIIRNQDQRRMAPLQKVNNRSFPKIIPTYGEQIQQTNILNSHKLINNDKKSLKQKLKSIHKKKQNFAHLSNLENQHAEVDEANITNHFQKEIQKNLLIIKKEKEDKRKLQRKPRYTSPVTEINSSEEIALANKRSQKLIQDENVFMKINEIFMNFKSRQQLFSYNQRNISSSALFKDHISKNSSNKKIKTQPPSMSTIQPSLLLAKEHLIKHDDNYKQWRRLSIDSSENEKVKYDMTSYQIQADRLQKIRNKNDRSLRKYFEGKDYLNQLINSRESASSVQKKL